MRELKKRLPLLHYILSYLSFALIACSVIAMLLWRMAYINMRAQAYENASRRLQYALEDFAGQLEIMRAVAIDITNTLDFKPYYFRASKYYEIELLKQFSKYRTHSLLTSEYFLYYINSDVVFRSSGCTTDAVAYFNGRPFDAQSLDDMVSCGFIAESQALYYLIPVYTSGRMNGAASAILGFHMTKDAIAQRIDSVSGGLKGEFALLFGDQALVGDAQKLTTGEILHCKTQELALFMSVKMDDIVLFVKAFEGLDLTISAIGFIVIALMALIFGYMVYAPVKRIYQKHMPQDLSHNPSLHDLDNMLVDIKEQDSLKARRIGELLGILRLHTLTSLTQGSYSCELAKRLNVFGISLPGPRYCVYIIDCEEDAPVEKFAQLIEDLSSDGNSFYCLTDKNRVTVVGSIADEWQQSDICDVLNELAYACTMRCQIYAGTQPVYDDVSRTHMAYMEALASLSACGQGLSAEALLFNDDEVYLLIDAVKLGDESLVRARLQDVASLPEQDANHPLVPRLVYTDALRTLLVKTRELQADLSGFPLQQITDATDPDAFMAAILPLVLYLTQQYREDSGTDKNVSEQLVKYIDAHYMEYDISLDKLSDTFSVSSGQAGKMIRQHTGRSYKDYLTGLRVEYAKRLLRQGDLRVADVCARTGYANISHFIKVFRLQTGITPLQYKKNLSGG